MGSSDWPTWWVVLAPVMMLAFMAVCMTSMRCMMRGPWRGDDASGRARSGAADLAPDHAPTGPHVPARFPDGNAAFQDIGTARDKAEFDRFMTAQRARPSPPS
jgi:hypothetical protein